MRQGVAYCLHVSLIESKCERVVSIIITERKGHAKNIKPKIHLTAEHEKRENVISVCSEL